MKPFRKHVAIAIDGGGIKGVMIARALAILEDYLGQSLYETFRLVAGTSTGSIIAAGIAAGKTGQQLYDLYCGMADTIFCKSWRYYLWPLARYRYSNKPLEEAIKQHIGDIKMGDFWSADPPTDVVITAFDLVENRTRFIKPYKAKEGYDEWPVVKAVLASSAVPTYFPVVEGRFIDGGVGAYTNPCYLAAYEARFCLEWDPAETTLISLGTGRDPHTLQPGDADRLWVWNWLDPLLGAFIQSTDDEQVHVVSTLFEGLDFRRFQVDLREPMGLGVDISKIPQLTAHGDELGRLIISDKTDRALETRPARAPHRL
ncbi:MAG: patatin-like phospholipase family protein [Chloroflexi bacterium]|nr:patatin-like phospholipase family protein [Chloroflexota bacterium]